MHRRTDLYFPLPPARVTRGGEGHRRPSAAVLFKNADAKHRLGVGTFRSSGTGWRSFWFAPTRLISLTRYSPSLPTASRGEGKRNETSAQHKCVGKISEQISSCAL